MKFLNDMPNFHQRDFEDFIEAVVEDWGEETKLFRSISQHYGHRIAEAFHQWLYGSLNGDLNNGSQYHRLKRADIVDLILKLETPKTLKILERTLGAGQHGVAIKLRNGLVIKKLFSSVKHIDNYDFYVYAMKVRPKEFLPVVRIGKDYIISKEVQLGTAKCRLYDRACAKAMSQSKDFEGPFFIEFIDDDIKDWFLRCWYHLNKIGLHFSDFRLPNIGEYKGEIVFIDP